MGRLAKVGVGIQLKDEKFGNPALVVCQVACKSVSLWRAGSYSVLKFQKYL
jgi:hypothetical protein